MVFQKLAGFLKGGGVVVKVEDIEPRRNLVGPAQVKGVDRHRTAPSAE